jgi:hypothetical protein
MILTAIRAALLSLLMVGHVIFGFALVSVASVTYVPLIISVTYVPVTISMTYVPLIISMTYVPVAKSLHWFGPGGLCCALVNHACPSVPDHLPPIAVYAPFFEWEGTPPHPKQFPQGYKARQMVGAAADLEVAA